MLELGLLMLAMMEAKAKSFVSKKYYTINVEVNCEKRESVLFLLFLLFCFEL
jgi:hypothetical protein